MATRYIPSANISVFPAGFRDSKYDLSAKVTSEQNLTNIIKVNKNQNFNNFVLVFDTNKVILGISGYRFIVNKDELNEYKYAGIRTKNFTDNTGTEGSGAGSIGNMLVDISSGNHNLDIEDESTKLSEFTGLVLFTDESEKTSLELTDYIEIVRNNDGDIIEKGFRLSTDSVINNSTSEVSEEVSINNEFTTKKLNVNNEAIIKSSETDSNCNKFTLDGEGINLQSATSKKVIINNIDFEAKTTEDEISFTKNTSIKYNTSKSITFNNNGLTVNDKITVNGDVKVNLNNSIQIGEDGNKIEKDLFIGKFGNDSKKLETTHINGYYFDQYGNLVHKSSDGSNTFNIQNNSKTVKFKVYYENGNVWSGGEVEAPTIKATTSVTAPAFYAGSDRRIKENIKDTEIAGLDIINNISVKEYNLIADEEKKNTIGCIAQELREVLPDNLQSIVKGIEEKETLAVDNDKLIYILIKAVQELSKEIEELKK